MIRLPKIWMTGCTAMLCVLSAFSQETTSDTTLVHQRVALEWRPEHVFATNDFLKGKNSSGQSVDFANSLQLAYSFRYNPGHKQYGLYGDSYQGVGIGFYSYNNSEEIGSPFSIYVFQGARLTRLGQRAALNYEWNFGVACGWHTYNAYTNPYNGGIGSHVNAYINAGVYVNFILTRRFDLIAGVSVTHFSNGNTSYPNAGINNGGARLGVVYYVNRQDNKLPAKLPGAISNDFRRHIFYDFTAFGAWRHGYTTLDGERYAMRKTFPVAGFNVAAMYAIHRKFNAGLSFDATYDGSGNLRVENSEFETCGVVSDYEKIDYPSFSRQFTAGLSVRAEYEMPFFTIAAGIGNNFIHSRGDMRGFYQTLTLKVRMTQNFYLNIGYNLKDFHTPNHLMLGLGYRIKN